MIAGSCAVFVIYVSNAWLPVFFMRLHGLGIRQVGYWLALCVSLGGAVGAFGGGYAADQLKRRFALAEIWVPSVAMLLAFPVFLTVVLAQNTDIALLGMFLLYSLAYIWMGPTCAIIQRTAPAQCRALATGLQLFIGNIVGLALGPPLIGFISDTFSSTQGAEGLRTALLFGSSMCLLSSGCYLYASKFLNADLARKKTIH
jgi:MFS family permease